MVQGNFNSTTTGSHGNGLPAPANTALTIGNPQQPAVRGVHITGSHVVPLGWPVYAGVVLHIQLLAQDNKGHQPGKLGASTQRQLTPGSWLHCLDKETVQVGELTSQARGWPTRTCLAQLVVREPRILVGKPHQGQLLTCRKLRMSSSSSADRRLA